MRDYADLRPWILSGVLTHTRTVGEIGFNKNGTELDIWIRVNGDVSRYSVHRDYLIEFLEGGDKSTVLVPESDGNAENITKKIFARFTEDDDLIDALTSWAKKLYDKLIEKGFSEEQVLTIVAKSSLMDKT